MFIEHVYYEITEILQFKVSVVDGKGSGTELKGRLEYTLERKREC
jgi:hypothetical protein